MGDGGRKQNALIQCCIWATCIIHITSHSMDEFATFSPHALTKRVGKSPPKHTHECEAQKSVRIENPFLGF